MVLILPRALRKGGFLLELAKQLVIDSQLLQHVAKIIPLGSSHFRTVFGFSLRPSLHVFVRLSITGLPRSNSVLVLSFWNPSETFGCQSSLWPTLVRAVCTVAVCTVLSPTLSDLRTVQSKFFFNYVLFCPCFETFQNSSDKES